MKYKLKHLNNPLNNFLDWFIADKIKNSEGNDDLIRRHRIIIFLLSSTVVMYFIALLYFTFFAGIAQRDFVVLMGLLIFYTGLLLLLKRTGAFTAVVLGQLLSGIVGMLSLTLTTGGINSPAVLGLIEGPLFTMLILGVRASLLNLLAVIVLIVCLNWGLESSFIFAQIPQVEVGNRMRVLSYVFTAAFLTFLGWLYESARLWAYDGLELALLKVKKTNEDLRLAQQTAEAATLAKSEFLANMSHEIRTPLNTVIGMTDLLLTSPQPADQREYTQMIHESSNALLALLNDILDFSKIEAGKLDLEARSFSVAACVREAVKLTSVMAGNKKLSIITNVGETVPECIVGDQARLRQILINLLSNAIKFTEVGEIKVQVTSVSIKESLCQLQFSVKDTGIGMAAEAIPRLFHSFSQVDTSTTRRYGGTGLGLVICKRLVNLMGGEIEVESTLGQGSVFRFTILAPLVPEEPSLISSSPNSSAIHRPQEPDSELGQRHPLSILVAEDNALNQKVIRHMLERLGYQATIVTNGQDALTALQTVAYDLLLLDVQMPVMDGVETTKRILQLWPNKQERPYIVAMTANALTGDKEKYLNIGMDGYLSKPIRLDALADVLQQCPINEGAFARAEVSIND